MNVNNAQAMLFGLVCSDFVLNGVPENIEDKAELLHLSDPMVNLLVEIEARLINYAKDMRLYFNNSDSLVDFVILTYSYQNDIDKLEELIRKSSQDTNLLASQLGIIAVTHCIIEKRLHEDYFAEIWKKASGISDKFDMTIRKIGHVLGWGSEHHAMRHLGTGEKYEEIVTLVLYCILQHPTSYLSAVECASKAPHNNSTLVAQIVAMLMGLRLGIDELPPLWIEYCKTLNIIYHFNSMSSLID